MKLTTVATHTLELDKEELLKLETILTDTLSFGAYGAGDEIFIKNLLDEIEAGSNAH